MSGMPCGRDVFKDVTWRYAGGTKLASIRRFGEPPACNLCLNGAPEAWHGIDDPFGPGKCLGPLGPSILEKLKRGELECVE